MRLWDLHVFMVLVDKMYVTWYYTECSNDVANHKLSKNTIRTSYVNYVVYLLFLVKINAASSNACSERNSEIKQKYFMFRSIKKKI